MENTNPKPNILHKHRGYIAVMLIVILGTALFLKNGGIDKINEVAGGSSYNNSYFYKPTIGPVDHSRKFDVDGDLSGSLDSSNGKTSVGGTPTPNNGIIPLVEKMIHEAIVKRERVSGSSSHPVGSLVYSILGECPKGYLTIENGSYTGEKYSRLIRYIRNAPNKPWWLTVKGTNNIKIRMNHNRGYFLKVVGSESLDRGVIHESNVNPKDLSITIASSDLGVTMESPELIVSRAGSINYNRENAKVLTGGDKNAETEPKHIRVLMCMSY